MSQVLWNVRLLDLEAGTAIERRALTIEDGRVTAIDDAEGPVPVDARDLDGATVLPGLIDSHCHVLSDTERSPGFGPPPLLHGEAPRPAALGHYVLAAAGARIVKSGFTTVRDVGSHDDEASALKLAVNLGIVPGPSILTCGRIVSATAPGGVIFGSMYREADGPWTRRTDRRDDAYLGSIPSSRCRELWALDRGPREGSPRTRWSYPGFVDDEPLGVSGDLPGSTAAGRAARLRAQAPRRVISDDVR